MILPTQAFSHEEYQHILRVDLVSFVESAFYELNPQKPYMAGAHIEVLATKLEACRRGEIRRLVINLPPRNLKSHCVSIAFSAWLLGHHPTLSIICASYGQDLADKLARDARTLMYSAWYKALFATRIGERQSVHDFSTEQMGGRMATSVGGVLTGRGADFIILDDPLKPDEALSESQRRGVNEWYDNSLLSRLNDKATGCIIIVMQRLHQNDLVGHVLEKENWEVLSFPAIAETDEVHLIESSLGKRSFVRHAGEALHPARESLETLAKIRREIGEYNFESQYQQNPTPPGGAMVKTEWLRYYERGSEPARFSMVIQSWDTANKAGELNDYSVCTTWGINDKDFYLLDVFRKRLNYPDLKRAVLELKNRYRGCTVLIEDKASGTQLIQELKQDGHLIKPYLPPTGTDKVMRLNAQTTYFENGYVFFPKQALWLNEYVAELTGFPGAKYNDQVDSTTQFLGYMRNTVKGPMRISEEALRKIGPPPRRFL
jgi:predicted phage terminase large subunit-like protein